ITASDATDKSVGHPTFFRATKLRKIAARRKVRIRITRPPPAPRMDGFEVGHFQFNHIYNVAEQLGRYLIVAGYGEPAAHSAERTHDRPSRRHRARRK